MGFFGFGKKNKEKEQEKMKTGLEKTRTGFWGNILNTLTGSVIDDDMYDDLEEQLILADVGGEVAVRLVDKLRDRVHEKGLKTGEEAADALRDIIAEEMTPDAEMDLSGKPAVILVIGVNGVGKTTSIAKLADHYTREGKKVMLAAGDTFRAAASEQLEIWADRAGVPLRSISASGRISSAMRSRSSSLACSPVFSPFSFTRSRSLSTSLMATSPPTSARMSCSSSSS